MEQRCEPALEQLAEARERVKALEGALRPFAEYAVVNLKDAGPPTSIVLTSYSDSHATAIRFGHFAIAAAALADAGTPQAPEVKP